MIDASLDQAVRSMGRSTRAARHVLPRSLHPDGTLWSSTSGWWTSGFFAGSLWSLYERTGDPELKRRALARTRAVERESRNASDHDIGFKVFTSFGHAWRITGDSTFVPVLLTAATRWPAGSIRVSAPSARGASVATPPGRTR